jgi:hypothetical protein
MQLEPTSVKVLLSERLAEDIDDSRSLGASVVFQMPDGMRDTAVREFLGWMRGSSPALVKEYERAATIPPDTTLGDLEPFQRAALIGALRVRREIE